MEKAKLYVPLERIPQFENYEWGSHIDTIIKIVLGKKGCDLIVENVKPDVVRYKDTILNNEAEVEFCFTWETQRLYSILLDWNNIDIFIQKSLREILTSKYGNPEMVVGDNVWLRWERNQYLLEIRSKKLSEDSRNIQVFYRSDRYHSLHEVELVRVKYGEETDRF